MRANSAKQKSELVEYLDRICDEFETQWKNGLDPDIAVYLSREMDPDLQRQLFAELLALDIELRRTTGKRVVPSDYEPRFPNFREQIYAVVGLAGDCKNSVEELTKTFTNKPTNSESESNTTPSEDPNAPLAVDVPNRIGAYVVLNKIAEHGQGIVYRANHPALNRQVVIKVSNAKTEHENPQRLQDEARALAQLNHPNVATVYDLQTDTANRRYLVMEYIEGRNLSDILNDTQFNVPETIHLVTSICRGLQHAHDLGILHLDLKPGNIVVRAADKLPKIIDFGLAQLRPAYGFGEVSSHGGTWRYMAPEQAAIMLNRMAENEMVRELDVRADVFALGAILYEMLTRKPLRQSARNYRESLNLAKCNAIDAQALTQAGIPPLIKSICLRALAAEPADRVGSAAELATLLVSACRPSVQRRRPMLIASAIALVACLTAAFRLSNNPKYSTSFSATTEARRISPEIQVEVFTKQDDQSIVFREWIGQEIVSARFGQLSRVSAQLPEPRFCYLFGLNPTNNVDEQIQLLYPTNHDLPPELQASFSVPASKTDYLPLIDGVGQQVYLLISSLDSLPAPAVWLADNGKPLTWSQVTQAGAWVYSDGQIQLLLGSDSKERAEPITIVPGQFRDIMDSLRVTLKSHRIHVDGIAFPVQAK